jgi:hypothetical protein
MNTSFPFAPILAEVEKKARLLSQGALHFVC